MNNTTTEESDNINYLSPFFIGAHGENADTLEILLQELVNDHMSWRKQFHPADVELIPSISQNSPHFQESILRIRAELKSLSVKMQHSAPIHSPRYMGPMASDLMLPALIAQLVTTFYNPNNAVSEAGVRSVEIELEVGKQFAELFGFNTNPEHSPCAWGHLTSGGTNANYESLWNFRAVKYYPIALFEALKIMDIQIEFEDPKQINPLDYTPWQLSNLSIDEILHLRAAIFKRIKDKLGKAELKIYSRLVEENRLETMGPAQFFAEHWKIHQPVVLVPASSFSFWKKAMRLLGFGSAALVSVPTTQAMRLDAIELERILNRLLAQNIPVLAVIGNLGSKKFGTIDPIHSVIQLQQIFAEKGLMFYVHVDASWGGYFKSIFKDKLGNTIPYQQLKHQFKQFPSFEVYQAFLALAKADSITIAPHSLGYLPQGIGGFIARNREIVKLLNYSETNLLEHEDTVDLRQLSRYVMDGSKPGANAAAAFVTHKVLPLNSENFGKVIEQTIHATEYFYHLVLQIKQQMADIVIVNTPFVPDTNLMMLAINPKNNHSLSKMNTFQESIYALLKYNSDKFIQPNEFLTSITSINLADLSEEEQQRLLELFELEIQPGEKPSNGTMKLLSHSLSNPWLLQKIGKNNFIDSYCQYLTKTIEQQLKHFE